LNIEVTSSIISSIFIVEYISISYDIDKVICCELLQSKTNDVYKIETTKEKFILKIYKYQSKKISEINFEIEFVSYLKKSNLNVANYISKKDGDFILKIDAPEGMRYALLTTYAEGNELEYTTSEDAFLYGLNIAKIHKVSQDFKQNRTVKTIDVNLMLEVSIRTIEKILEKEYLDELEYFQYFFKILKSKVKYSQIDNLKKTFCHGDLHGGNAHKNLNNITFFDFDFCGYGLLAYDISVFRWGCIIMKGDWQWQNFIKGYRTINTLDDNELEKSLLFVAIQDLWVMHLYLSRIDTMGQLSIHKFYIQKRIKFLKNLEKQI